ncbi:hypothetical protein ABMA27_017035 [Loxostege sticticalis]|uniref:Uncharacterized protein n=1 Tax=Loxostege sticticalis TaxID=481309 RepID=A0ABR3GYC9_LOXSC
MHGIRRVIIFCALIALLPITLLGIPLFLRHNLYADVVYAVTESDILEMSDGVSTIFCSAQTLTMNGTFNAFQMDHRPEITTYRKHIRLKKSMTLPDDTLEYWGFYLLRGATVALSVCSRFPGASILVVKGDRSINTCGMLDHNKNKARTTGIYLPQANEQVKITFDVDDQKRINSAREKKVKSLREKLNSVGHEGGGEESGEKDAENLRSRRRKRNQEPLIPPALLDHGIQHGGNALRNSSESSVSSFEEGLLNCYEGQVLLAQEFEPSELCTNVSYLVNGKYMQTRHDVSEDGYYYYIFYSDNDIVFNDIHALFDIYKPTFQYENVTNSCLNKTECTFPLTMLSNDRVIVEVPTKDGIDHEQDDVSLLISVCRPRMGIYTIFPIALLFLIICCAFM